MQQFLINAVSSEVRLALRIYFTLVLLLVGFIGDRCCALRVRLRLHRRQVVNLREMTGWLGDTRLAMAAASLRAVPAGWLGAAMLLAAALSLVCDLAVSSLVVTTQVVDRCHFNTTGIYATLSTVDFNFFVGVESAGALYDLVTRAQGTSLLNGGIDGIYHKVNSDLTFRADKEDIVGQWNCTPTGAERTFPTSYNTTEQMQTIGETLTLEGLIFSNTSYAYWDNSGSGPRGYFIWSAPIQDDHSHRPWTVLAAAQMSLNTSEPKLLKIYSCALDAPYMEWLLPLMEVESYLGQWGPIVQANMYPIYQVIMTNWSAFHLEPGKVIASKLNAAIMIAGQSWGNSLSPRIINDPTQGCLGPRTLVPWSVVALFLLTALLILGLSTYLIGLHFLIRSARNVTLPAYAKAVDESTPNGLLSWMRQATDETNKRTQKINRAGSWTSGWRFGPLNSATRQTGLIFSTALGEQNESLTMLSRRPPSPIGYRLENSAFIRNTEYWSRY